MTQVMKQARRDQGAGGIAFKSGCARMAGEDGDSMSLKEKLRHLIDELPEEELHTAERFLVYLRDVNRDPFLRALAAAPEDEEPRTEEEREALTEAYEDLRQGRTVSHEEIKREFDL